MLVQPEGQLRLRVVLVPQAVQQDVRVDFTILSALRLPISSAYIHLLWTLSLSFFLATRTDLHHCIAYLSCPAHLRVVSYPCSLAYYMYHYGVWTLVLEAQ